MKNLKATILALYLFPIANEFNFAQETIKTPEITPETISLYNEALSKASADPEYVSALKAIEAAQRNADSLLFQKVRKLEPRISSYVDYLEQIKKSQYMTPAAPVERKITR